MSSHSGWPWAVGQSGAGLTKDPMNRHPETFLDLATLGRVIPPYRPTYDFPGDFAHAGQRAVDRLPLTDGILVQKKNRRWFGQVIPGWLRREDALKLYELAFFAEGDILEVGSYQGLSTAILAQAARDSGRLAHVYALDISPLAVAATERNLRSLGLHRRVSAICAEARATMEDFAGKGVRFGFAFVDHAHDYRSVVEVCAALADVLRPGAFCLFHDFNDFRNADPAYQDYGVYQGVADGLEQGRFEFWGIYGCCGLYRALPAP